MQEGLSFAIETFNNKKIIWEVIMKTKNKKMFFYMMILFCVFSSNNIIAQEGSP
jgi:hypothetical protein